MPLLLYSAACLIHFPLELTSFEVFRVIMQWCLPLLVTHHAEVSAIIGDSSCWPRASARHFTNVSYYTDVGYLTDVDYVTDVGYFTDVGICIFVLIGVSGLQRDTINFFFIQYPFKFFRLIEDHVTFPKP